MPLAHVLWRLAEGRTSPLHVRVATRCEYPSCPLQCVELIMCLDPSAPKPTAAGCPLCARAMRNLSAAPMSARNTDIISVNIHHFYPKDVSPLSIGQLNIHE